MRILLIGIGLIIIQLSCTSNNERTFFPNGQTKTELIRVDDKRNILKEYNETGSIVSEYELIETVKNGKGRHFTNGKLTYITSWKGGVQSLIIEDLSDNKDLGLINTFPDTLKSGDTLSAFCFLKSKEWRIKQAYLNCDLDQDGILLKRHKFSNECVELPIYGDTLLIRFQTIGKGNKILDESITIIAENNLGINQVIRIGPQKYYLK